MKVRDFSKIYFALLILQLATIYQPESHVLFVLSKPLLLFSLLAFFVHRISGFGLSENHWISAALFSFMVGDILLIQPGQNFFIGRMVAFVLGHFLYIRYYFTQKPGFRWGYILPAFAVVFTTFFILHKWIIAPDNIATYYYIYLAVLGFHLVKSAQFGGAFKGKAFLPTLGMLFFITAELVLVYNKFNEGDRYIFMAIAFAYGMAQYLITIGLLYYIKEKAESEE